MLVSLFLIMPLDGNFLMDLPGGTHDKNMFISCLFLISVVSTGLFIHSFKGLQRMVTFLIIWPDRVYEDFLTYN